MLLGIKIACIQSRANRSFVNCFRYLSVDCSTSAVQLQEVSYVWTQPLAISSWCNKNKNQHLGWRAVQTRNQYL